MKIAKIMALACILLPRYAQAATKIKTFVNETNTAVEVQVVYQEQVTVPRGPYKGKVVYKDSVHRVNLNRRQTRGIRYPADAQVEVVTVKILPRGFLAQWGYRPEGAFVLPFGYPFVQDLLQPTQYALYLDKQHKQFLTQDRYAISRCPQLGVSLQAGGIKVFQENCHS